MSRCKDRSKNPKRRVQNTLEHRKAFSVQEPIRHFWALAQRPLGDDKAHPFRSFRKKMSPDSYSTLWGYFLEFSGLYK